MIGFLPPKKWRAKSFARPGYSHTVDGDTREEARRAGAASLNVPEFAVQVEPLSLAVERPALTHPAHAPSPEA